MSIYLMKTDSFRLLEDNICPFGVDDIIAMFVKRSMLPNVLILNKKAMT